MSKALTVLRDLVGDRQNHRLLRLSFPNQDGPTGQLLINKLDAFESLSKPFEFRVELLSDNPDIPLKDMQGKMLCVQLVRRDGTLRYFTGIVFSFALKTVDGGVSYYEALLGPWYKYLGLRKDNYLFHYTTMYQQTASIFGDYGSLAEWDWRVAGATDVLTDCCQFDESDRNFLERRWVGNGIVYWFEHSENGHKMVLSDDTTSVEPIDGGPSIRFQRHGGAAEEDGLGEWSPSRQIMQGAVALAAFDFKSPKPVHTSLPTVNQQGDVPTIESYEYTGAYGFTGGGRSLAQLRIEEFEAAGKQFEGSGNNRNVLPGRWFRLADHFDVNASGGDTQAHEFLILEVVHSASNNYHVKDTAESHYENRLRAIRKIIPYRAGRDHNSVETKIHGIQTATVVGPAGEEIHTDEFGRVRVQFHWDRAGTNDEKSSAWLRVATPWAGANFGMTSIPRIGGEVLVAFMDGNPNRPIITGMVPNADTMPPWTLPANKTQSGILSRSTPGGSYDNANALRFEDKKGSEQLWLHAEKDQLTEVEHDEDKWVGNDRRKTIDRDETTLVKRDRTETVNRNETITVHHDRTETVHNNETITIHNNRAERVDHNEKISIGDNRSEDVGKNETIDIGGNRTKSVVKNEKDTIGKSWSINVAKFKTETVGMAYMQNVGMGRMENVGLGYNLNVGMVMATVVGEDQITKVGKKIATTAGEELSITVGKATLVMKADGTITFNGHTFSVGTTDEQTFKADGNITMKGKKIQEN
ncbi:MULTISPECIES: type VI secretion system Vgr family protein [Massilia]|uniref:Type VI secretion system tip protein VgrG n=1 Tax=Massilia frigida TaxID=2609281 RepID=A0ABX0N572_9BURK|nr:MULTISPECIES: type VI secretion system tip protein TssI/VgrG [Massilia]MDQ1833215.1 type VI secretion system tip protein TssI/VgrG [Massilia sp. CCM 9029]NHZ80505.1 type VI secretion system tip protein VgrG [Massilia frigida]